MDNYLDPEERIQCPYVISHYIRRKVFNTHLIKCKKNSSKKLVACDFNENHLHTPEEIQHHHEICPDRHKMELVIYKEEGDSQAFPIQKIQVESEESWDDYNVEGYDAMKHCERTGAIINFPGEQRAVRAEKQRKQKEIVQSKELSHKFQQSFGAPSTSGATLGNSRGRASTNGAGPSISGATPDASRNLPATRNVGIQEEVPSNVEDLMKKIRSQSGQSYKQKKK